MFIIFCFSYVIIFKAPEVDTKPYPRDIMIWSERFYKGVFNNLVNPKVCSLKCLSWDFLSRWTNSSPSEKTTMLLGILRLAAMHKVRNGNDPESHHMCVVAIAKNRFVHHTSFLWGFSPQCMEYLRVRTLLILVVAHVSSCYLQMPKKTPDYRLERDHLQFLTELRSHYTSRKHVETNFMEQLALTFPEVVHVPLVSTGDGGVTPSFQEHIHSALAGRNLTDISRTVYVDLNEQV